MNETFLRSVPLPGRVRAVVVLDENGDYNVYVNTRLSHDEQIRAFEHERSHILSEHFRPDLPAAKCEKEIAAIERQKRFKRQ
ncbi:MAG: hypothetical protein J5940_00225 [Clostridia bacterium]|nr:hypothetical protein [Clostridia bacterium]